MILPRRMITVIALQVGNMLLPKSDIFYIFEIIAFRKRNLIYFVHYNYLTIIIIIIISISEKYF